MTELLEKRAIDRKDLAWSIAVGGCAVVAFAALGYLAWYFAATLFLIFAGVLFGVFLSAVTDLLGRLTAASHTVRLIVVCLLLAALFGAIATLGGTTIADQAAALSGTIKSQILNVKTLLEQRGIDTSFLDLGSAEAGGSASQHALPSAGTLASGGSAIFSQTLKLVLGTIGAVGNFFIVVFLGLCFAAQPSVYRLGLLSLFPAAARAKASRIVDDIGDLLQRWLLAQMITMAAVFIVTAIGLAVIGVPGAFILGIQAGLLAFVPTVGAIVAGLVIMLASIASGWVAVVSAFVLFLGVHAMESYVLTPLIQRQAIDIPPATLFATQILLGTVFGLWGLALALPLMVIVKVVATDLRAEGDAAETPPALPPPAAA